MKYLLLAILLCMLLPVTYLSVMSKQVLRGCFFVMVSSLAFFDLTKMNFFADPYFRAVSRGMEISVIYVAGLAIILSVLIKRWRVQLCPDFGYVLYLLFIGWSAISLCYAPSFIHGWMGFWQLLMMCVVFCGAWNYFRESGDVFSLWGILAVFTWLNFGKILIQKYVYHIYQVNGLFPHQNSMAMFFTLVGPIFIAKLLDTRSPEKLLFWGFSVCAATASVIWSFSRGAFVSYPIGCVIAITLSLAFKYRPYKLKYLGVMCLCGFLAIMSVLPRIIDRFINAPESSGLSRIYLAKLAVNLANSSWHGVGLNSWILSVAPPNEHLEFHENITVKGQKPRHYETGIVESAYLLTAAECGWTCLVIFALWLLYYLVLAARLLVPLRNSEYLFIPCGAIGGLTGSYLQTCLEWVIRQSRNSIALMFLFALLSFLAYAVRRRLIIPDRREQAL